MSEILLHNKVLQLITKQIYDRRKSLPEYQKTNFRIEKVNDNNFAELWFLTAGCSHDRSGGCTMCNYGKGRKCTDEEILAEINKTLENMPEEYSEFIISPIGSILDKAEVSDKMLGRIKECLKKIHTETIISETRADTVTEESLNKLRQLCRSKYQCVELGMESADDWVLRNCVNKGINTSMCRSAIEKIKNAGMYAIVNVGIGIPFMSERAAILKAVESAQRADAWGADSIVLFPYHVKPGTLMGELYLAGEYQPVSLWSLVEALVRLDDRIQKKTRISWYKNYYKEPDKILCSPYTCDSCYNQVIKLLDEYKNFMSREIIEQLNMVECNCKEKWRKKVIEEERDTDFEKIAGIYRKIALRYRVPVEILEQELVIMKDTYC